MSESKGEITSWRTIPPWLAERFGNPWKPYFHQGKRGLRGLRNLGEELDADAARIAKSLKIKSQRK